MVASYVMQCKAILSLLPFQQPFKTFNCQNSIYRGLNCVCYTFLLWVLSFHNSPFGVSYEVRIIFKFCFKKDILLRSDCFDGIYEVGCNGKKCKTMQFGVKQRCLVQSFLQCLVQKHIQPRTEFGE